jgi:hypothetical protein
MTTRTAVAVTLAAVIGLVVSVTGAWSQLAPDAAVRESQLGPRTSPVASQVPEAARAAVPARRADLPRVRAVPTRDDGAPPRRPVRVALGSVGIDAAVRPVGVAADGQMQLPPDPRVLGWYRFGPVPGADDAGSVVIAGHLDSRRFGVGPLVRLRDVEPGDTVEVEMSDRSWTTYVVEGLTRFDQQALPDELFSRSGAERLRIITCGGDYDVDAGQYEQNLVVTAVPA